VEALCEVYPNAHLFALLHNKGSVSATIERMPMKTSFVQFLPRAATSYRHYLPLFPAAVRQFDLDGFDCVISSNHCVAKGVRVPPQSLHICYCHTPMRYIWVQREEYLERAGLVTRLGMRVMQGYLRRWDLRTAANPGHYIANSENVRRRIQTIYHRDADVIYPPVNTSLFDIPSSGAGYFLIVSALVPYKLVDLAVRVFTRTRQHLVIVGEGPDSPRLRAMAGPNVTFAGWQPDERLRDYYAGCAAVIFPGEEDFGMVPIEAMAAGKPVVALARGGARETVVETPEGPTGVLFDEPTPECLINALDQFKTMSFDPALLRRHALSFDREIFKRRMKEYIEQKWDAFRTDSPQASV